ncbi:PEF-CTERM sorting domain-containing protein [Methanococcoides sp. SA1]|nr:PEF-CTERM sorting domain-containing protein [Methanococcoides sp. SA1]
MMFAGNAAANAEPLYDIILTPDNDINPQYTTHTVTATLTDANGNPIVGELVNFGVISGPHTGWIDTDVTDTSGNASFTYMGWLVGTDEIIAYFVDSQGTSVFSNTVEKSWTISDIPEPSITLAPVLSTNPVGTDHTVIATVTVNGNPVVGGDVILKVLSGGSFVPVQYTGVTDSTGQATFTYTGTSTGTDVIAAYFVDNNGQPRYSMVEKVWTPQQNEIPEFPTIALPIIAVLGLAFFFQRRRN